MLCRLHETPVPAATRDWEPVVGARFAAELALTLGTPWGTGPYGERARASIGSRVADVGRWTTRYRRLVAVAAERPWVATHGEPHSANQLVTSDARLLLDWESLRRAPAERDLRTLVENGYGDLCAPDWEMVEMFDLEWRLDEIAQYAAWFAAPHTGTKSDEVAYGGLLGELERAEFATPA
jgi:spectinomycin phosphotransferase